MQKIGADGFDPCARLNHSYDTENESGCGCTVWKALGTSAMDHPRSRTGPDFGQGRRCAAAAVGDQLGPGMA